MFTQKIYLKFLLILFCFYTLQASDTPEPDADEPVFVMQAWGLQRREDSIKAVPGSSNLVHTNHILAVPNDCSTPFALKQIETGLKGRNNPVVMKRFIFSYASAMGISDVVPQVSEMYQQRGLNFVIEKFCRAVDSETQVNTLPRELVFFVELFRNRFGSVNLQQIKDKMDTMSDPVKKIHHDFLLEKLDLQSVQNFILFNILTHANNPLKHIYLVSGAENKFYLKAANNKNAFAESGSTSELWNLEKVIPFLDQPLTDETLRIIKSWTSQKLGESSQGEQSFFTQKSKADQKTRILGLKLTINEAKEDGQKITLKSIL